MRQANRLLDEIALERATAHDEVHVDFGEHLRVGCGALRPDAYLAATHVLAALFEDHHHVVGGAAARADEDELHRPGREVPAAAFRRSVYRHHVIASSFGEEGHALARPAYGALHRHPLQSGILLRSSRFFV